VLTMSGAADSCETMTFYNALESFTLRSTDNIDELHLFEYIAECYGVAEFELSLEVCREFDKLTLRGGSCLFKMPFERGAGMLFSRFVIGKLYSGITIFLYCTNLRNNTWTSLNNGAWNIFSISTENGSHSDFLSN